MESDKDLLRETLHNFVFEVLGLQSKNSADEHTEKLTGVLELLIQMRKEARENKDFATSDKIRDQLSEMGIQLKDSKEGTTFTLN